MRDLRVVGVNADGTHVVCQDTESNERFQIPADERLRAAARGDISRLGQIEIEMESSLRPREIQSRIRAGATVAEVAAAAGVPPERIERFAHPVLLERTRATELAALAHPIRTDGPSEYTLAEVVADGLVAHGRDPQDAEWDAWKVEDGFWVVQIGWQVGHSDHYAHWRFHLGSHGGTAEPLDELADELTHPETIRPQRRLTPVSAPDLTPIREITDDGKEEVTFDADSLIGAQRARGDRPRGRRDTSTVGRDDGYGTSAFDFDDAGDEPVSNTESARATGSAADTESVTDVASATEPVSSDDAATSDDTGAINGAAGSVAGRHAAGAVTADLGPVGDTHIDADVTHDDAAAADVTSLTEPSVADTTTIADDSAPAIPDSDSDTSPADTDSVSATDDSTATDDPGRPDSTDEQPPTPPTPATARRRKSGKPPVPAWEDVLLGVRSNPNS